MRYKGNQCIIEELEQEIKKSSLCFKRDTPHYDNLFGIESIVKTRVYDMVSRRSEHVIPIRFWFENRDDKQKVGWVDIRAKDMGSFLKISGKIVKILAKLDQSINSSDVKSENVINEQIESEVIKQ